MSGNWSYEINNNEYLIEAIWNRNPNNIIKHRKGKVTALKWNRKAKGIQSVTDTRKRNF